MKYSADEKLRERVFTIANSVLGESFAKELAKKEVDDVEAQDDGDDDDDDDNDDDGEGDGEGDDDVEA